MAPPLGIIVNPRSGTDVRRALAAAVTTTFEEKIGTVRRAVLGAIQTGVDRVVLNHDPHQLARRATETMRSKVDVEIIHRDLLFDERDTMRAVATMRELGCGAVVVLGGDGTNRAAALAWPGLPVVPISTGTNNAFPLHVEPTVAGAAAGLVATGAVDLEMVARPAKVVAVEIVGDPGERGDHGPTHDLALVDAVAVDDPIVGSLELFDPTTMRVGLLTRADPAAIGFSSIGGLLHPVDAETDAGLLVRFVPPHTAERCIRAPTAPGHYATVGIADVRPVALGEVVEVDGPLLLEFDGERTRRLGRGQTARLSVERTGPRVVDVAATMSAAVAAGRFDVAPPPPPTAAEPVPVDDDWHAPGCPCCGGAPGVSTRALPTGDTGAVHTTGSTSTGDTT